jgi:hypothetical protein
MLSPDARFANWRFVVPDEPEDLLLLDDELAGRGGRLDEAIRGVRARGVVLPDISAWADGSDGRSVLRDVAGAVAPAGWLCVGFANRLCPPAMHNRHALSLFQATTTLESAGLVVRTVYLPLPDHRRPAFLIDSRYRGTLDYVLRHLFLTYLPGSSSITRLARLGLVIARRMSLLLPHGPRVLAAPGYVVIAGRPHD